MADAAARRKLLAVNELLHLVSGQLSHLVGGDDERYPGDVFADILLEAAEIGRCEWELVQAFEWSSAALPAMSQAPACFSTGIASPVSADCPA